MPEGDNASKIKWRDLPLKQMADHDLARVRPLFGKLPIIRGDKDGWSVTWHSQETGTTYSFTNGSLTSLIDRWNEFVFVYEHGWHTLEPHYDEGDPEWYLSIKK